MGAGRLVENGVTGLIVEPGDVDALATALRRMADDAAFRESCASAARVAADRFEYDVVGRERIGLLRQVAHLRL
jgi:glycosyltransferase involved in cell wall biosynthesis